MGKAKLSFFGLGYVGTVYSAGFASKGFKVTGFDTDKDKLKMLDKGAPPIHEPGLEELMRECKAKGTLRITDNPDDAVSNSDITFITVGTPSKEDGSIDLKHVVEASNTIGGALKGKGAWHLIVVKSTVTPGTTEKIVRRTVEKASGKKTPEDYGLAVNPEFLREGSAIEDFMKPDRIIIGANDEKSRKMLEEIYSEFDCPKILTNPKTAELIKYVNNAFLAMKVSFINMIANLCQEIPGCDVDVVARGIGLDRRIGEQFLRAGAGWGGSCLPKDLKALKNFSRKIGVNLPLVEATLKINDKQPLTMIKLTKKKIGNLKNRRVAVLGLSFKPDTDDMREAVSIKIVNKLIDEGAEVTVYDPAAMKNAKKIFQEKVIYAPSTIECLKDAECALIVTEWSEFKELTPEDFIEHMKNPVVIDGRRIFNPETYASKLEFEAIGLRAE